MLLGGRVNRRTGACLGAASLRAAEGLRPSLLVLGVCGVDAEIGITAQDYEDAEFKRVLASQAGAVVAAVLNEKLASVAPFHVLPPAGLETLVVEHDAPEASVSGLEAAGIRVLRARPPTWDEGATTPARNRA